MIPADTDTFRAAPLQPLNSHMNRHIALVEDDEIILGNYADFLGGLGFEVDRYSSKAGALQGLLERPPELVLLDISLNGERDAGFAICAEIRRNKPLLPVIFLTSHDAEVDKISGLRLDADDYITKEVSLDYLVVRIEALFRRRDAYATNQARHTHSSGAGASSDIEFDAARSTATWRLQPLDLTLTQFWILQEICRVPGRIKSTAELMRAAKLTVAPNTIAAHVKAIREAFLRHDSGFDRIRTERGRGYRWIPG
jgi:two-component system OmpR family response regulator